jgi:hypothetical protein
LKAILTKEKIMNEAAKKRHEAHQAEYAAKLAAAKAYAADRAISHPASEEDKAMEARAIGAINKAINS